MENSHCPLIIICCLPYCIICTSAVLTQDGLHRNPQEPPDVSLLVDDGDAVDQRDGVHQVREVDEGAPDQAEPE